MCFYHTLHRPTLSLIERCPCSGAFVQCSIDAVCAFYFYFSFFVSSPCIFAHTHRLFGLFVALRISHRTRNEKSISCWVFVLKFNATNQLKSIVSMWFVQKKWNKTNFLWIKKKSMFFSLLKTLNQSVKLWARKVTLTKLADLASDNETVYYDFFLPFLSSLFFFSFFFVSHCFVACFFIASSYVCLSIIYTRYCTLFLLFFPLTHISLIDCYVLCALCSPFDNRDLLLFCFFCRVAIFSVKMVVYILLYWHVLSFP